MVGTLGSRVRSRRRQNFVGREQELAAFTQAVETDTAAVFYVWGPGGIGKSTLLSAFGEIARERGYEPKLLDARDIEPSPQAILQALGPVASGVRLILLIDTAELLENLQRWLFSTFLLSLPGDSVVVIAGRTPPPREWRTDAGWAAVLQLMPLRNFAPGEATEFLSRRSVPVGEHERAIRLTYGHPLALALVADIAQQNTGWSSSMATLPRDAISELVDLFVESAPDARHQDALYVLAHARATTEELISDALGEEHARDVFGWLSGLSFVYQTPDGLAPHDLARDALDLDLRWRSPQKFHEVHKAVREWVIRRIKQAGLQFAAPVFIDLLFLHRHNPLMTSFTSVREAGKLYLDEVRDEDFDAITRWTEELEGPASREIVEFWWASQRDGFKAIRDLDGRIAGFCAGFRITGNEPGPREADPVFASAMHYINQVRPMREGEHAWLFRHWIYPPAYQVPSPAMDLIYGWTTMIWLTTPGVSWTFVTATNGDMWEPMFSYLSFERAGAEFAARVGSQTLTLFGHDWRIQPPDAWLDAMGQNELLTSAPDAPKPRMAAQPVVLAEAEFRRAARTAIKDVRRPSSLAKNPLARSRLGAGDGDAAQNLAARIVAAAQTLGEHPRDEKHFRVVQRTYLEPAPTQEVAAELLDLPWSTYRRHLTAGIERIVEVLWQQELDVGDFGQKLSS